jgi:hypothetical protein
MPFDWQAEQTVPVSPSNAAMVPPPPKPVSRVSFAQALTSTSTTSSNDNLPQPVFRGESVSITISQEMYEKGMFACKRNLRGRLVLNKGDTPYSTKDIHTKLQNHWKTAGPWSMRPLGRGFYEFTFATENDLRMVWAMGTINMKPGVLRLFEWTKDFNKHRNSHAQVWIRLLELPQEYWMDRTLREIASAVGTPLLIDKATSNRTFGHYARILVDMDFSRRIFHEITVERIGYAFTVEVAYEWMPDYCTHCHNIGHDVSACRWLYPRKDSSASKEAIVQGKKLVPSRQQNWVPSKENPSGIGSSIAFAAPQKEAAPAPTVVDPNVTVTHQNAAVSSGQFEDIQVQQQHPVHHVTSQLDGADTLQMGTSSNIAGTGTADARVEAQHKETPAKTIPPSENMANQNSDIAQYSFSMPLENVTDAVARTAVVVYEDPVITPVNIDGVGSDTTQIEGSVDKEDVAASQHAVNNNTDEAEVNPPVQQHVSKNIQDGLDLWARIREYDQRMADEGYTQVLTKAQKETRKKLVLGTSYKTRAKGALPSSK